MCLVSRVDLGLYVHGVQSRPWPLCARCPECPSKLPFSLDIWLQLHGYRSYSRANPNHCIHRHKSINKQRLRSRCLSHKKRCNKYNNNKMMSFNSFIRPGWKLFKNATNKTSSASIILARVLLVALTWHERSSVVAACIVSTRYNSITINIIAWKKDNIFLFF